MSDLKPCPVCKGQSGGIGSDGVENDCMACFTRDVQAASPRVEACIASCLARYHGESKAAQARYFEEVHQRLAPLARSLEIELAEAKAELARRTQPEATAPAPIPGLPFADLATPIKEFEARKAAALASSANALSAGDRVDALPPDVVAWVEAETARIAAVHEYNAAIEAAKRFGWPGPDTNPQYQKMNTAGNVAHKLIHPAYQALAAILQSQKGVSDA